jgi:hypothetical protein
MTRPVIARIGVELAAPFVLDYCRRWNVPVDNLDQAEEIWWWGCILANRMRACMGLQLMTDDMMFVWGFFGDGSGTPQEARALATLTRLVDQLPWKLEGVILLENERMRRHARKHGWRFHSVDVPSGGRPQGKFRRESLEAIREATGRPTVRRRIAATRSEATG